MGKRTAAAAFRIATQLVDEGLIDADEAVRRVSGAQLVQLMFPRFDSDGGSVGAKPGRARPRDVGLAGCGGREGGVRLQHRISVRHHPIYQGKHLHRTPPVPAWSARSWRHAASTARRARSSAPGSKWP